MAENNLVLGITKVGDLLLQSKISKTNNTEKSRENINLTIPNYQRPYKWTVRNAVQLLDDIVQAMVDKKEVYRVGTLILYQTQNDEGKDVYEIVDGQQRTITFSLLLKSLGENKINFLSEKLDTNEYNLHNVKSNYKAFERRLGKSDENKNLLYFIKEKCEFIVVITTDLSETFQFFDSQNARGKTLYPHDLLKAYHLREMKNSTEQEVENTVKIWEDTSQNELSALFSQYLYRLKEWCKGNKAQELSEKNIDLFKGISSNDNQPYAQFYKGAFAYADNLNHSAVPFVTGSKLVKPFQITAPVIAGKPFFEYTKHYFDLLKDIKDNDKYKGYFINGNEIVSTLDKYYCHRIGDKITRLMFDTAVLLYVDRFCPLVPTRDDLDFFDRFVEFAFIWAYSMRAQYYNVGWLVAQNYIIGNSVKNSFNIYKMIFEADSPNQLISKLSDALLPLSFSKLPNNKNKREFTFDDSTATKDKKGDDSDETGKGKSSEKEEKEKIVENYLHWFNKLGFLEK